MMARRVFKRSGLPTGQGGRPTAARTETRRQKAIMRLWEALAVIDDPGAREMVAAAIRHLSEHGG